MTAEGKIVIAVFRGDTYRIKTYIGIHMLLNAHEQTKVSLDVDYFHMNSSFLVHYSQFCIISSTRIFPQMIWIGTQLTLQTTTPNIQYIPLQ